MEHNFVFVVDPATLPYGSVVIEYSEMCIKAYINQINDRLKFVGYVFLNTVLDIFGIPRIREGQVYGWDYEHDKTASIYIERVENDSKLKITFAVEDILVSLPTFSSLYSANGGQINEGD